MARPYERGFISQTTLVALLAAMLLSGFLSAVLQRETESSQKFFEGMQAQLEAEAGLCETLVKLNKESKFFKEMDSVSHFGTCIMKSGAERGYQVYIAQTGTEYLLYSCGWFQGAKRQVVAHLQMDKEKQHFSIIRISEK